MSEKEKQAAKEVIDSLKQIPPDGADYVRGYLQGRLDSIKAEKKEDILAAQYYDDEYIIRKLLTINGDADQFDDLMQRRDNAAVNRLGLDE